MWCDAYTRVTRAAHGDDEIFPADAQQADGEPGIGPPRLLQRPSGECNVGRSSTSGGFGVATDDRLADRPMLCQQAIPNSRQRVELRAAVEHAATQHFRECAHDMQNYDVMRSLVGCQMQFRIGLSFFRRIDLAVGRFHARQYGSDRRTVEIRRPLCRKSSSGAFDHSAEFNVIERRLGVVLDQELERLGQRPQKLSDPRAVPIGLHQAPVLQQHQRIAQRWPRDAQLLRQLPLSHQPFARTQYAFTDKPLQMVRNRLGNPHRLDRLVHVRPSGFRVRRISHK